MMLNNTTDLNNTLLSRNKINCGGERFDFNIYLISATSSLWSRLRASPFGELHNAAWACPLVFCNVSIILIYSQDLKEFEVKGYYVYGKKRLALFPVGSTTTAAKEHLGVVLDFVHGNDVTAEGIFTHEGSLLTAAKFHVTLQQCKLPVISSWNSL